MMQVILVKLRITVSCSHGTCELALVEEATDPEAELTPEYCQSRFNINQQRFFVYVAQPSE